VIEEVLKHDPEYKPPADYKPRKFSNKIYIPINEYPGYNFIGVLPLDMLCVELQPMHRFGSSACACYVEWQGCCYGADVCNQSSAPLTGVCTFFFFAGLIIGPRGNTQKRMQRETNCKIAIRGRGSVKEGISKDPKYDYGEDEELHVLITGETQDDVRRAVCLAGCFRVSSRYTHVLPFF
jgi:hypothetical protein